MGNLTLEPILVLLLFILLWIVNWLLTQMLVKHPTPRQAVEETPIPPVPFGAAETQPAPQKTTVRERVLPRPTPRASPPRTTYPATRLLLKNKREVRRGIISMTLLGPCRALESPQ
jgi:hypothetical protein